LDEAKLDLKAINKQVFFGYQHNTGMTGHNWPDFFCKETVFEVLLS